MLLSLPAVAAIAAVSVLPTTDTLATVLPLSLDRDGVTAIVTGQRWMSFATHYLTPLTSPVLLQHILHADGRTLQQRTLFC